MQQHMATAANAAEQLVSFFQASHAQDWSAAEDAYNTIRDIEHQADELKMEIRLHLPKTLFLPVPRQDLLELLRMQDQVANVSKDIAGLMLGRKMVFPANMQESVLSYVDSAIAVSQQALSAVRELDELLEFGFKGRELSVVEKMVQKLNILENNTDQLEVKIRSDLFAVEADIPPIEAMFLYRIIEQIGLLADTAERVGSRLLLLIAR